VLLVERCFCDSKSPSLRWCCGITVWGSRWLLFISNFTFSTLLSYELTPSNDSVLRHVVNNGGMNKLSQLSNYVSFIIWAICLGSTPVYIAQGFCTINRACLSCSPVSMVTRNRSGAAKPRWGMNVFLFSAAISAHRWWIVASMYGLSSPMWYHVLGFGYLILYLCLFSAPLGFYLTF
jgi:hypothetical protein